jgi:hypothetical protein
MGKEGGTPFGEGVSFWLPLTRKASPDEFNRAMLGSGKQRRRAGQLCLSEIMTILIHFHQSHYRDFKSYYSEHVQPHLRSAFPGLVSYERFVQLTPGALDPCDGYLRYPE